MKTWRARLPPVSRNWEGCGDGGAEKADERSSGQDALKVALDGGAVAGKQGPRDSLNGIARPSPIIPGRGACRRPRDENGGRSKGTAQVIFSTQFESSRFSQKSSLSPHCSTGAGSLY